MHIRKDLKKFGNITELFSATYISKLCKYYQLTTRQRKTDIANIFIELLREKLDSSECNQFIISKRFAAVREQLSISNPALHFHLSKPEFNNVLKALLSEAMRLNLANLPNIRTPRSVLTHKALKGTGCKNILAIDGTEVVAQAKINEELNKKPKGRKRNETSQQAGHKRSSSANNRATLKVHVFQHINTSSIVGSCITHGTFSERHVLLDFINQMNTDVIEYGKYLVLGDRGYFSKDVIKNLDERKFKYILRMRSNSSNIILQAFDKDGNPIHEIEGCTLSSKECSKVVKKHGIIDCQIANINKTTNETINYRVVMQYNAATSDEDKDKIMYLATNLDQKKVNAEKVILLYRLRWQIENDGMQVLKSHCGLNQINSGKVSLNVTNFLSSLITHQLKFNIYLQTAKKFTTKCLDFVKNFTKFSKQPSKASKYLPPDISLSKVMGSIYFKKYVKQLINKSHYSTEFMNNIKKIIIIRLKKECLRDDVISMKKWKQLKDSRLLLLKISDFLIIS